MPGASTHRNKRACQPSITSYFTRINHSEPNTAPPPAVRQLPHRGLASVPVTVQASLLNVGMRVRKAVPEGYKTHKTLPRPEPAQHHSAAALPATGNRPAELLPYCGLHKTGGHAAQQSSPRTDASHHLHINHAQTLGAVDAQATSLFQARHLDLLSSQESSISTDSLRPLRSISSYKRRHDDGDGDDSDSDFDLDGGDGHLAHQPRSRRALGNDSLDFGEADFLRPSSDW